LDIIVKVNEHCLSTSFYSFKEAYEAMSICFQSKPLLTEHEDFLVPQFPLNPTFFGGVGGSPHSKDKPCGLCGNGGYDYHMIMCV
jgi:hypothetical protein